MHIPWFTLPPIDLGFIGLGTVSFFSIFATLGVVVTFISFELFLRRGGSIDKGAARPVILSMFIGAYLGSYWGQILFYKPEWLADDPLVLFKIWRGGYSAIGGFYGCALAGWLYTKWRKEPFIPYLDRAWFAFSIGWIFARMGCATIHDHPGIHTDFFLGLQFPDGVRHDLGLYELLFTMFVLVPILFLVSRKPWPSGKVAAAFHLVYAPARFFMDFLRIGDARYFGLTPAQYGTIIMFAFGLYLVYRIGRGDMPEQPALW